MPSGGQPSALHRFLYYRLHALRHALGRPGVALALRIAGGLVLAGWLLFVVLVLGLRYSILPRVAEYRAEVERVASVAVGQPVQVGRLTARWRGLNPELVLDEVGILDARGVPALTLARVEGALSWSSLWRGRPVLDLLSLERPVLHVRRDAGGRLSIAGIAAEGEGDPAFAEWLLEQRRIRIHDATIVWEDVARRAPPLVLEDLQFGLDNSGRLHRFGLSAAPPAELAARLDLRGEVRGDLNEALEHYSGRLYLELAYADLAGWQPWIDYPVHLPSGRGALRAWGDLADGGGQATVDVALEDVRVRLGAALPELDLASLRGRLAGSYRQAAWSLAGQRVELLTREGIRVVPTDFQLDWRRQGDTVNGNARANLLDLGALARLAAYLPLDARSRQLLGAYAPQGQVAELRASWGLQGETLNRYALAAGFSGLGVGAVEYFPGAHGLAGKVDLTEKGGTLQLDAGASTLSLPAVFPEPDIEFDRVKAQVDWKNGAALDLHIKQLEFAGHDAAGSAQGSYRYSGEGPGEIDLQAKIDRARGDAVWRYMPHVVNETARHWLRRGITAGTAHDGRLVLKGNLRDFPFRDPSTGQFLVTARAEGARIDYAPGWPVIEDVAGNMAFDYGMRIDAQAGRILGTRLPGVKVSIADFDHADPQLLVRGAAEGPTGEFLKFIDRSPVAEAIDHFTDGMRAIGDGRLDLELDIPLADAQATRMRGRYHFHNNQVHIVDGLPMIGQVNGWLDLTERLIVAPGVTGRAFGGPLKVQVQSNGGKVGIDASGTASIGEVSRHFGWPLVDRLSGSTPWKAEIAIEKRNATVRVSSDLVGISSPLPDPLNKTAASRLPLRVERSSPVSGVEQYRITLGDVARGQIVRRDGRWAQGVLVVGRAEARLPEQGLAIRVAAPRIDADAWRLHLPGGDGGAAGSEGDGLALGLVQLETPLLHLFGQDFRRAEVSLQPRDAGWRIGFDAQEAGGDLLWRGKGDGWLEGRLRHLRLGDVGGKSAGAAGSGSVIDALPGMNLVVDDLVLDAKALGRLEVRARNQGGTWLLERLDLNNPDARLSGTGQWARGQRPRTQLAFDLKVNNIGGLLTRLGYEDAIRDGQAALVGNLRWSGPLTALDYPSLAGEMTMHAEKGQFNKLEPGVGRLLGLLSLQSLPRRLTLDFRDLFSAGLAFDRVDSQLKVDKGIMRTVDGLTMKGPAVDVRIDGETDLAAETQDLQVLVRPEVGSLAAVGTAALVNPVAGAAALIANTVLKGPLNQLFSYRYHVTGRWADPLVAKVGQAEAAPAASEEKGKP